MQHSGVLPYNGEGDSRAVGKAELVSHSTTRRQWESALHFLPELCAQQKLKSHTHVHTLVVAVMGDILLKKTESDPVSLNMIS